MRRVAIAPVVGILLAALTSTIGASGVNGAYTCSSSSSCLSANQSAPAGSTGAAIKGAATNSYGVRGVSTNSAGTLGQSAAGSVMYPGVEGESTNNNGSDVAGGFGLASTPAYGVFAMGSNAALEGSSIGGVSLFGVTSNPSNAKPVSMSENIYAKGGGVETDYVEQMHFASGTGYLIDGAATVTNGNSSTSSGFNIDYGGNETLTGGLSANSATLSGALTAESASVTNNLSVNGSLYGENASFITAEPNHDVLDGFFLQDAEGDQDVLFEFDPLGNEVLNGNLYANNVVTNVKGTSGTHRTAYGAHTTTPTIEDVGEGRLVGGNAFIPLDPDLADMIDRRSDYHVFLTPKDDCNGLYVRTTPTGFYVRELHNGRSSIAFDYRLIAKPVHEDGRRLAIAPPMRKSMPAYRGVHGASNKVDRFAVPFHDPAKLAIAERAERPTDALQRLKQRLGPSGFAAALAEFKRQQRK